MNAPQGARPGRLGLWLSLLLCTAGVFWITEGVAPWNGDRTNVWHHYEYLTEGFLAGHTSLSVLPAPELAKLKDPYDPAQNARYRLWDASLYQGKYYLYYGPAPAVALMLPWRILTGHMLPQRMAVALFAAAGLVGLALLLLEVRAACFPGLSGAALGAILLAAFHAAWLPVILRRPGVWELPIVSATACLWWALYFLWRFRQSGGRVIWAALSGAALMLMIGCRVTNVFEAGAVILLLLAPFGRAATGRTWGLKAACIAASMVAAGGVALLLYNHARFGRWLEFGQSTMLGGSDIRSAAFLNPSYIPFNMWTYLVSMPELGPYFPFVHATWPVSFPEGYLGYEAMFGALFAMPVQLAGFLGLAWAWRNRREPTAQGAAVVVAAAVSSSVFAGAILFCWQGACSRYIAELFAGWTVVTAVGLMAVFGAQGVQRPVRWLRVLASAAACWTIACVWLASAEFRGFMRQTNPATYRMAAHTLDYPSAWWIRGKGIQFGPVDLEVRIPPASPAGETVLVASGFPDKVNQLVLDGEGAERVRLVLRKNQDTVLETHAFPVSAGGIRVRLTAPWLYPPPEHPYWDGLNGPTRRELQARFSVDWGPDSLSANSGQIFDASGFEPVVRTAGGSDPRTPYVAAASLAVPHP